jgi:hypothetical protein
MKYLVTYRLLHPEYFPSTGVAEVKARTHAELNSCLVKLLNKWRADGYTVRVLKIKPGSASGASK